MDHPAEGSGDQTSWATHPSVGLLSSIVVLAALLSIAATEWRKWHIGLLAWGLVVAVAAALYPFVIEKWALRRFPGSTEATVKRLHSRQRLSGINMGIVGLGVGVVASGTGWIAVDAGFTAFLVLVGGASFLAGVYLARRHAGADGTAT